MPSLPRNGTIAQPRSYPRRPNPKQIQGATYVNTNSVMNSFFYNGFGLFGSSQTLSEPSSPVTKNDAETVVKAATAANTVKKRRSRTMGLYMPAMITQRIPLSIIYLILSLHLTLLSIC